MNEFKRIYDTTETTEAGAAEPAESTETPETEESTETVETTETPDTESVQETGALSEDMGTEQLSNDVSESAESLASETVDPADVSSGDPGTDTDTVSGGDLADVSGSDLAHDQTTSPGVVSPTIRYTAADPIDYTDTLAHIDYMLTLIVFLLLFGWAAHHIRNAVRSFTGRGIK